MPVILNFIFMCLMLFPQQVCAKSEPLEFTVNLVDPTMPDDGTTPRCPIAMPSVNIEGRALYFTAFHPKYHFMLLDECGEVVYEAILLEDTSLIELPFYISGTFKVILQQEQKMFTSMIKI